MKILETHIVPATSEKIRLQEYAASIFQIITTRSGIKKAIKRNEILIDGKLAKTSDWIETGQKIELLQPEKKQKKIYRLTLAILYEDDDLAIINKPSGLPTSGNYFKTVENALPYNLKNSNSKDALPYPLPVHRLDNPTSGLLICAKTRIALSKMQLLIRNKAIQKTYVAFVKGIPPQQVTFSKAIQYKYAKTLLERLETVYIQQQAFSLVKLFPETGRTHQIRIHLSQNGFPIIGDKIYGGTEGFPVNGIVLSAVGLDFFHPIMLKKIKIELPLPKKFLKVRNLADRP